MNQSWIRALTNTATLASPSGSKKWRTRALSAKRRSIESHTTTFSDAKSTNESPTRHKKLTILKTCTVWNVGKESTRRTSTRGTALKTHQQSAKNASTSESTCDVWVLQSASSGSKIESGSATLATKISQIATALASLQASWRPWKLRLRPLK